MKAARVLRPQAALARCAPCSVAQHRWKHEEAQTPGQGAASQRPPPPPPPTRRAPRSSTREALNTPAAKQRNKLTTTERGDLSVFVQYVMRRDHTGQGVRVWDGYICTQYRGETQVSVNAFRRLLEVVQFTTVTPGSTIDMDEFVKLFVEYATAVSGKPFFMSEDLVLAVLRHHLQRVTKAKRKDVTCYAGSDTHKKITSMHTMFTWMVRQGHAAKLRAWTVMVQAAGTARFATLVRFILRDMAKHEVTPDVFVLSNAIMSFKATVSTKEAVISNLRKECLGTWADFASIGVVPDARCYAALITVLNSFGDTVHAEQVFSEMKERGFEGAIDTRVYTSLLAGVRTEERLHQLIREMSERSLALDSNAFCAVMNAVRRVSPGNIDKAEAIFQTAVAEKVALDEMLCCSLLCVYRDARKVKKAAAFLTRMISKLHVTPTSNALNMVLETAALCVAKKDDDASKVAEWVWRYCTANGIASHHSYGFMMQVRSKVHDYNGVVSLFSRLKSDKSVVVNLVHFNYLIAAYQGKDDAAAVTAIRALPAYQSLASAKQAMQDGRRRGQRGSVLAFTSKSERTGRRGQQASAQASPPSAAKPSARRDPIGVRLAQVADTIGNETTPAKRADERFALDDVLGI
eukprot:Rhum_TRINITY_DN9040_c0_g2::Rhum_TRINITY_DN9040_c0_g2_i1::g.31277::m.31277